MVGVPVVIRHKDLTKNNADDERVGVVSTVWFDDKDGWYWCDGIIWDETAINLILDKGWSVSCSYDVLEADDSGGTWNNTPYDMEFLNGVFTHLALVDNPRYEKANIVFNSKTVVNNGGDGSGNFNHKGRHGEVGGSLAQDSNVIDLSNKFNKTPTIQDVKKYINELVKKGANFATLSPDWFVDLKVNSKAKKHIIYSSKWNKMSAAEKERHNKYLADLENLLNNAEYIGEKPNTKANIKSNIEKYHYFKTIVQIGQNSYEVIFDTEQYSGESTKKPQTVHLYNVHEIKKAPVRSGSGNSHPIKNTIGNSNIILANFTPHFNPKTANIKEHEDMTLIEELKKLIQKVENNKGDSMKKANNEDVDKREILREADAIAMKSASDFKGGEEEKFATLTKKLEELSYNKSDRGTSDNEKDAEDDSKADNEGEKDEEEYKDFKKEIKEEADNKKSCKNKADNAKTSYFDELNKVYNAPQKAPDDSLYVSRDEKLKAAQEYFS